MRRASDQLTLIDVPRSPTGPARVPRSKAARAESPPTLPLPFDASPSVRLTVTRGQAMLLARLKGGSSTAPPTRAAAEPENEESELVLIGGRRPLAEAKRAFVAAVAEALEVPRRGEPLDLHRDGATLRLSSEAKAIRVRWFGDVARRQWLPCVRRLAREHGLVELD